MKETTKEKGKERTEAETEMGKEETGMGKEGKMKTTREEGKIRDRTIGKEETKMRPITHTRKGTEKRKNKRRHRKEEAGGTEMKRKREKMIIRG